MQIISCPAPHNLNPIAPHCTGNKRRALPWHPRPQMLHYQPYSLTSQAAAHWLSLLPWNPHIPPQDPRVISPFSAWKAWITDLAWQPPLLSSQSSAQMSPHETTQTAPLSLTRTWAFPANLVCFLYSVNTLLFVTSFILSSSLECKFHDAFFSLSTAVFPKLKNWYLAYQRPLMKFFGKKITKWSSGGL